MARCCCCGYFHTCSRRASNTRHWIPSCPTIPLIQHSTPFQVSWWNQSTPHKLPEHTRALDSCVKNINTKSIKDRGLLLPKSCRRWLNWKWAHLTARPASRAFLNHRLPIIWSPPTWDTSLTPLLFSSLKMWRLTWRVRSRLRRRSRALMRLEATVFFGDDWHFLSKLGLHLAY